MKFFLAFLVTFTSLVVFGQTKTARDQNLVDPNIEAAFRGDNGLDLAMKNGQAMLLRNNAEGTLKKEDQFYCPNYCTAVVVSTNGELYRKADLRYNREFSSIEVFIDKKSHTLSPAHFDKVVFEGGKVFRGLRVVEDENLSWGFGEQITSDLNTDYVLYKKQTVKRSNNDVVNRGIVEPTVKAYKLDSVYILTGLREDFALVLERKAKKLANQLALAVNDAGIQLVIDKRALRENREAELKRIVAILNEAKSNL